MTTRFIYFLALLHAVVAVTAHYMVDTHGKTSTVDKNVDLNKAKKTGMMRREETAINQRSEEADETDSSPRSSVEINAKGAQIKPESPVRREESMAENSQEPRPKFKEKEGGNGPEENVAENSKNGRHVLNDKGFDNSEPASSLVKKGWTKQAQAEVQQAQAQEVQRQKAHHHPPNTVLLKDIHPDAKRLHEHHKRNEDKKAHAVANEKAKPLHAEGHVAGSGGTHKKHEKKPASLVEADTGLHTALTHEEEAYNKKNGIEMLRGKDERNLHAKLLAPAEEALYSKLFPEDREKESHAAVSALEMSGQKGFRIKVPVSDGKRLCLTEDSQGYRVRAEPCRRSSHRQKWYWMGSKIKNLFSSGRCLGLKINKKHLTAQASQNELAAFLEQAHDETAIHHLSMAFHCSDPVAPIDWMVGGNGQLTSKHNNQCMAIDEEEGQDYTALVLPCHKGAHEDEAHGKEKDVEESLAEVAEGAPKKPEATKPAAKKPEGPKKTHEEELAENSAKKLKIAAQHKAALEAVAKEADVARKTHAAHAANVAAAKTHAAEKAAAAKKPAEHKTEAHATKPDARKVAELKKEKDHKEMLEKVAKRNWEHQKEVAKMPKKQVVKMPAAKRSSAAKKQAAKSKPKPAAKKKPVPSKRSKNKSKR